MKNIAMKRFFIGSMDFPISLLFLHPETISPIMNAPMAIDRPARVAMNAIPNASPMDMIIRTSSETLSEIQLIDRKSTRLNSSH